MKRPFKISVRVTSQEKCQFGFYLLINGSRLRFSTKAKAIAGVRAFLEMQRIQVVSVSEYSRRKSVKKQAPRPPALGVPATQSGSCIATQLTDPEARAWLQAAIAP
jgi:hypothetical protein